MFVKFCFVYSLVKMVYGFAGKPNGNGQVTELELEKSIRRNFSGLDDLDPVKIFCEEFENLNEYVQVKLHVGKDVLHAKT